MNMKMNFNFILSGDILKRFIISVFAILFAVFGCACEESIKSDKISIVCTTFPQYDWVKNIVGDNADKFDIYWLVNTGADVHSYQPTAQDFVKLCDADLIINIGGESDEWAEENANGDVITMLDCAQIECEEEHTGEHEHEHTIDEHIWLSLKSSAVICNKISDILSKLDTENAETYKQNCENFTDKMNELDLRITQKLQQKDLKPLIFADRFPFKYFVEDYDLQYHSAFPGCSAETEASFETVITLANEIDKNGVSYVFTIDSGSSSIADTVISNAKRSDVEILNLNSLQSVSKADFESGLTYLDVMNENVEKILKAL